MEKSKKIYASLWTAIACISSWFFGFVYEQIVELPNMFSITPAASKVFWTDFHSVSNPVYYYILSSPVVIAFFILVRNKIDFNSEQRKKINRACIAFGVVIVVTSIAVTQINPVLFFGPPILQHDKVLFLAKIWFVLNFLRILFTFYCAYNLIRILKFSI